MCLINCTVWCLVVQSLSLVQLFAIPWTAAYQTSLSINISLSLLKLMSIESVISSNCLVLCRPLLLLPSIFTSIRVLSNESILHIRWYWGFSFSISPFKGHSGLISFRIDWLISLQSKILLQHHSSKASALQALRLLYGPTLTSVREYWKNHSFDYMDFCWQSDVSAF